LPDRVYDSEIMGVGVLAHLLGRAGQACGG